MWSGGCGGRLFQVFDIPLPPPLNMIFTVLHGWIPAPVEYCGSSKGRPRTNRIDMYNAVYDHPDKIEEKNARLTDNNRYEK